MYIITMFDKLVDGSVQLRLDSQTEVADFISIMHLSINDNISISISYERREDTRYDEAEPIR